MTTTMSPSISAAHALSILEKQLDLSNLRLKLAHPEDGEPPSEEQIDLMEAEYKKFLALRLAHPEATIVPCKLVDDMWHRHILDTRAYAKDCEQIFGEFMHHFPYFGLRGEDDAQALIDAYDETLELYRTAFGEPPPNTWVLCEPTRCRTGCKPMKCR